MGRTGGLPRHRLAPALEALRPPNLAGRIEFRHRSGVLRQGEPRKPRARVDMDVRRNFGGIVERAGADEGGAPPRLRIMAPESDLALGTAQDGLRLAAGARYLGGLRL